MEVIRNVSNVNDTILLRVGTQLTPQHLRLLKTWGIDAVHVAGASDEATEAHQAIPAHLRQAAEAHVTSRLKHVSVKTPSFALWKELAVRRAAARLASQPRPKPAAEGTGAPKSAEAAPPIAPVPLPALNSPPRFSNVKDFVQRTTKLPSLPSLYYELVEETKNADASVDTICGIVRKDQSLVSRLLKLANSVFYALPVEVDSLDEAVQIIGFTEVQNLVLATSIIKAFDKLPPHLVSVPSFWLHSIACGSASARLAQEWYDPVPERFFVGGLLHDIGRLLMFLNAPKESAEILYRCERESALALEVERQVLGFDHVMLGTELASFWRLPHTLRDMVCGHHNPSAATAHPADAFIVYYGDFITSVLEFGNSGELFPYPLFVAPAYQQYVLDEERIPLLVNELDIQCTQLVPILTA
jgi:HD-like signal output (HDOD) protein